MRLARLTIAFVITAFLSFSCSSDSDLSGTRTLTFSLEEGAVADLSKGYRTKAVDPSNWVVSCVSTSDSGTRTVKTGAWDTAASKFVVREVPNSQDTVCYMAEDGVAFATLQYEDSNAIGSKRDTSKVTSEATGKITYSAALGSAVVTNDSGIETTVAENRANYNGEWSVTCQDISNLITDEADASKSCPEELDGFALFPHLVMATDASTELKTMYGLWMSHDAYKTCGSTEGIDSKPDGWTLDAVVNPTMGNSFSWSAPFGNFAADSASEDIFDMIRAADLEGLESFAAYKADPANAEFCTDTDDVCAVKYYDQVLMSYGRENSDAVCWPDLRFDWEPNNIVTAYPMTDMASKTRPLSRYGTAEAFQNGYETYMRSFETEVKTVASETESQQCIMNSELLIALITPGGEPDGPSISPAKIITPGGDPTELVPPTGTASEMRFVSNSSVRSVAGTSAADAFCQGYLGSSSEKIANGFFAKAQMVMINPLPTP